MSRNGLKCFLVASALLLCAAAIDSAQAQAQAQAQSIQLRKQTKEILLPAPAKPKPAAKPEATPAASATPDTLTATQLFNKASPSVVVVKSMDKDGNVLATGSGVVVAHKENGYFTVATNCHVVDTPRSDEAPIVSHGENHGLGFIIARDAARDLCLLNGFLSQRDAAGKLVFSNGWFVSLPAPPVAQIAPLRTLEVGGRVYAIGAPQGLELSLSEGLVSGLRKDGGTTYIQTTAAISKGSSGGGLFDAQGRLVGITTMFLKDSQALNFAVPAELIVSVPAVKDDSDSAAADAAAAAAETAAAAVPPPPRDRWWTVYEDKKQVIALDTRTVQKDGNKVIVWSRSAFAKPKATRSGKRYVETLTRYAFYCGDRHWSYDQITASDADGDAVDSVVLKGHEIEISNVMPQTFGELQYEAACAL